MPRMESVRHDRRGQDVDVRGKLAVQPLDERVGREVRRDIQMGHLRQRVDAGVGPP